MIRFNKPYLTGKELAYIEDAIKKEHLSGDGHFSKLCNKFFSERFSFTYNFLTTSGTDALEMAAILSDIKPGDEVIVPSFAFVSTANAFVLRGANIIFADSLPGHPNINHEQIESLITPKTRAIVPIHYGGVACDMDPIMTVAGKYNIQVVEDAAHAIDAYYKGIPLGRVGDFGAFSFHETKNIVCGEGGMLVVKDKITSERAEIIREKGTNRTAFFRGEIDKYGWVDVGSSFLSSEILAAFLYAQLESLDEIQRKRLAIWERYNSQLQEIKKFGYQLPVVHSYATNNAHLFYIICPSLESRTGLIDYLKKHDIRAVFHYQPLHNSQYYKKQNNRIVELSNATMYGNTLVRLPLFPSLNEREQEHIIEKVLDYVRKQ